MTDAVKNLPFAIKFKWATFVLLLLALITWALGLPNFKVVKTASEAQAYSIDFETNTEVIGTPSRLKLSTSTADVNKSTDRSIKLRIGFPKPSHPLPEAQLYRFRVGLAKLDNTQWVLKERDKTLVYLGWIDDEGQRQYAAISRSSGSSGEKSIDKVVRIPVHVKQLDLQLTVKQSGLWQLYNGSLEPVDLRFSYRLYTFALVVFWVLWALYLIRLFFSLDMGRHLLLIGGAGCLVMVGVFSSAEALRAIIEPFLALFGTSMTKLSLSTFTELLDIAHFLAFFSFAILLSPLLIRRHIDLLSLFVFLFGLAMATEAFQMHVVGRSAQLFDLGIDLLGIAAGLLMSFMVVFLYRFLNRITIDRP